MIEYEKACLASRPDWVVVVGDVNSTLACALVATKLWIPVAHLEAGLRSGDRRMPEEINRLATDAICDLLWTPSPDGDEHLAHEGIPANKIERVGNMMIDSFELLAPKIRVAGMPAKLGLARGGYGVVTLHRPSNVDDPAPLRSIVEKLVDISERMPLVFPVHPRTRQRLKDFELAPLLQSTPAIQLREPLAYVEFMSLIVDCRFALTDSGGVQEETSYLGIPCLTLRENTERPITVTLGTNRLVKIETLDEEVDRILAGPLRLPCTIPSWDGAAAQRTVASLKRRALPTS
jgi:UDP-N-acetylglucosamine 2-epimerase (non-hydrolysing)